MEMITCQDLAKILQKIIDIFHPIEMMPCQDLVTYFQKNYWYLSPNEKYVSPSRSDVLPGPGRSRSAWSTLRDRRQRGGWSALGGGERRQSWGGGQVQYEQ